MQRNWNFLRLTILLMLAFTLQACGAANAIKKAETTEQRAYAAYGEFTIVEEQAAKLVSSGQLDNRSIAAIGRADEAAKNVADPMIELTLEVTAIRREFEEGGGTGQERYISAANNLNGWVTRLIPLIANLQSAKEGAEQ